MLTSLKEYIAQQMLYHKYHFKCDCLMPMDFVGTITGYRIDDNGIKFLVNVSGKVIEIDENHPKMTIESV